MSVAAEADVIRRMLYEGHLTRIDEGGHARAIYGTCPDDGADAPVRRVSRAGRRIVEVVLRCPSCGRDFAAAPEAMHLR
jgi:hypothetical protein